jgi:hypothetical protein
MARSIRKPAITMWDPSSLSPYDIVSETQGTEKRHNGLGLEIKN